MYCKLTLSSNFQEYVVHTVVRFSRIPGDIKIIHSNLMIVLLVTFSLHGSYSDLFLKGSPCMRFLTQSFMIHHFC